MVKYARETAHEAICSICGRSYWVTKQLLMAIKKGKVTSECAYCDKSHDNGDYEEEDTDE